MGHLRAPGNGRDLFIATTTGTSSSDRVEALVRNVIAGVATAKAFGVRDPAVGFLNLDGVARAHRIVRELAANGYGISLASSSRGDALLRGNDILAGSVDVLICDSLTGNAIVKLLAAFTTGGRMEVSGSGYGPGVGDGAALCGHHLPRERGARRGECHPADGEDGPGRSAAGLCRGEGQGGKGRARGAPGQREGSAARRRASACAPRARIERAARPAKKIVQHEIDGIDVLEIDAAAQLLASKGIYCETAMGCTGPVVLVADEDAAAAKGHLRDARFL